MENKLIPGPKTFFTWLNVFKYYKNPLTFLESMADYYGDFCKFKLGSHKIILIKNPDLIKDILVTNNSKFARGKLFKTAKTVMGDGLITAENDIHFRHRRIIQPIFNNKRIFEYGTFMAEFTEIFQQKWQDGETLEICSEMSKLTLGIVAHTLFGLDIKDEEMIGICQAINIILVDSRFREFVIRKEKFNNAINFLNVTITKIIEERKEFLNNKNDLLTMLLQALDTEGDKKGFTTQQIRDHLITFFLAGHETISNLLSWTWYLLSINPHVEKKLHNELLEVLGDRNPSPEDIPRLNYTKKVLTESMRLFPPVPILSRKNIETYQINNFEIPANTEFLLSPYLVHRDSRFYDDPLSFIPERWTEEFNAKTPKFAYFPFGGGPRLCIGEQFSWTEGILLLATIARKWKMELIKEHIVNPQYIGIILKAKTGIKMVLRGHH